MYDGGEDTDSLPDPTCACAVVLRTSIGIVMAQEIAPEHPPDIKHDTVSNKTESRVTIL